MLNIIHISLNDRNSTALSNIVKAFSARAIVLLSRQMVTDPPSHVKGMRIIRHGTTDRMGDSVGRT